MSTTPAMPAASAGPEATYFTALAGGQWRIQRCDACGRAVFYPRVLCPHCGSDALSWFEPSGRGTVYATTCVRRKAEAGGDYNVALVDLEEGVRMMSRVEGRAPDAVTIGLPVHARIARQAETALVVFDAARSAA